MPCYTSEVNTVMPQLVSYDQKLTSELTNDILFSHARLLLDRLSPAGWERAGLSLVASFASNDLHTLCNWDPDVLDLQPTDQSILRQCAAYFGKRIDIDIGVDREAAARTKFWQAERACKVTNDRFAELRFGTRGDIVFHPFVHTVLHGAVRKISRMLGEAPVDWDAIRPRLGPGATTRTRKQESCPVVKLDAPLACGEALKGEVGDLLSTVTLTPEDVVTNDILLDSASLNFVPKSFKTDRAICTEPSLNGMFQLGLGDLLADRLKTVGIDIQDQSANQRAALYGSISGASATLDLSSASDTVSIGLVEHLLPLPWFEWLMLLRSPHVNGTKSRNGETIHLEKISSMGNGFTFPLETTIFWALAQSVVDAICPNTRIRTLVYGDDIIVPVEAALPLAFVLSELGFTLNSKKSFWTGTFRESCGADYVSGINVRPVFVDDALTGADVFRLRNFFWNRGDEISAKFFEDLLHPTLRRYGPSGYGDGHLHTTDFCGTQVNKHGMAGLTFETWSFRPKKLREEIARRLAVRQEIKIPVWNPLTKDYTKQGGKTKILLWHNPFLVRKLATYIALQRETRTHTLTSWDRKSHNDRHVYADRRMPDPETGGTYDKYFVVPGEGQVHLTKVYIFTTSTVLTGA